MRAGEPTTEVSRASGSAIAFGPALLGLVPVVLAILVAAAIGCWSLTELARASNRAAAIHQSLDRFERLRSLLEEAESRERDYLIAGDQQSWQAFEDASAAIGRELSALDTLSRGQPLENERIAALARLVHQRLSALTDSLQVRAQMGPDAAVQVLRSNSGRSLTEDIRRRLSDMSDEQRVLLAESNADRRLSAAPTMRIIAGASALALFFLLLTAALVVRKLLAMRRGLRESSRTEVVSADAGRFMDAMLDTVDAGVVLLDRDLKVVRSNAIAQTVLKTRETQPFEALKAELESSGNGETLAFALEHLQSGAAQAQPTPPAEVLSPGEVANDADVASISATARAIRDDSGALQGGVLMFRDTSAVKAIERELEAREETLIGIFHYGLEAALVATLEDSLCVGVNEGFLRLSGYPREEIIGRPVEELKVFASAEDLRYAMERVRTGQYVRERASCFSAKEGRAFEATLAVLPIEFSGLSCALIILGGIEWRSRYFSSIRGLMPSPMLPRRPALTMKN